MFCQKYCKSTKYSALFGPWVAYNEKTDKLMKNASFESVEIKAEKIQNSPTFPYFLTIFNKKMLDKSLIICYIKVRLNKTLG